MAPSRKVAVVSAHMDLGAGRRGVDMGPSAIRVAGVVEGIRALGRDARDFGSILVREQESCRPGRPNAHYLREVVDVCKRLHTSVASALRGRAMPLVLGGDHSIAVGSISAVANHHRARGKPIGVLWIDAHTDINTPKTSPSGNVHGMPLSHLLGLGAPSLVGVGGRRPSLDARHVAILGVRQVDRREAELVRETGVRVFTMSEIDQRGFALCMDEAIQRARRGTAGIHVSFDLDGVDPRHAPGVGTPVAGGLTYREAHLACEKVARTGSLLAMDMVELNPTLDERNRTGQLAVELILSALGKTIL